MIEALETLVRTVWDWLGPDVRLIILNWVSTQVQRLQNYICTLMSHQRYA